MSESNAPTARSAPEARSQTRTGLGRAQRAAVATDFPSGETAAAVNRARPLARVRTNLLPGTSQTSAPRSLTRTASRPSSDTTPSKSSGNGHTWRSFPVFRSQTRTLPSSEQMAREPSGLKVMRTAETSRKRVEPSRARAPGGRMSPSGSRRTSRGVGPGSAAASRGRNRATITKRMRRSETLNPRFLWGQDSDPVLSWPDRIGILSPRRLSAPNDLAAGGHAARRLRCLERPARFRQPIHHLVQFSPDLLRPCLFEHDKCPQTPQVVAPRGELVREQLAQRLQPPPPLRPGRGLERLLPARPGRVAEAEP